MNWKLALNGAIAGAAVLITACGAYSSSAYGTAGSSSSSGQNPGAAGSPPGAPALSAMTTVALHNTTVGQILVDGNGRTLYLFEADKADTSSCYGDCATYWPPLIAHGTPTGGAGINQALLGTTTRKDGSLEVTYNGHPLYYFISDKQAGDTSGQALTSFGADWFVLSAAGNKVGNG